MTKRFSEAMVVPDQVDVAPELVVVKAGSIDVWDRNPLDPELQRVGYSYTQPLGMAGLEKQLIIMPSQWSEYAQRQPQLDREASITAATNVPTLALDMPGQSPNSTNPTASQRRGLKHGNWNGLSESLWGVALRALREQGEDLEQKEVVLFGMSQGGTIAASMAASKPEAIKVSDVVLWNSPSVYDATRRDWQQLRRQMALYGGKDNNYYLGLNPEWAYKEGPKDAVRWFKHPINHFHSAPKAIGSANDSVTLFKPLTDGRLPDVTVHLVHSALDRISDAADNIEAQDYLERIKGVNIRRLEQLGDYHAILNSLGAIAVVGTKVLSS